MATNNGSAENVNIMEKVVSLCKRRGFIFPGSEIYGGLAGTWDYGPLGLALKKNIENLWWRQFVDSREDMLGIDSAILMNPKVWEVSGHVEGFSDPLVECTKCKRRFRADHVETFTDEGGVERMKKRMELGIELDDDEIFDSNRKEIFWKCENCGQKNYGSEPRQFNMMFKTHIGAMEDDSSIAYLRPETAQGIFVNFKNIIDTFHPKLPFGVAQIGRSFRNEIAPRDFIFRVRELEIMEFEYFIREHSWREQFEYWQSQMREWFLSLGFAPEDIREIEIPDAERAHYSKRTVDFHFRFPHKFDEIGGLAYRTDFDLQQHREHSVADLHYLDAATNEKLVPHVLEPTFGLGRHVLAVITKAYAEDELGGEKRVLLKFPKHLAPAKAAVFPLLRNKPELVAKAREVYTMLKKDVPQIMWDDNGNIGKRYRRQDEIGTPFCVTIDFETLEDDTVTLRDRDTGKQERIPIPDIRRRIAVVS